jgi:hypothetical protein
MQRDLERWLRQQLEIIRCNDAPSLLRAIKSLEPANKIERNLQSSSDVRPATNQARTIPNSIRGHCHRNSIKNDSGKPRKLTASTPTTCLAELSTFCALFGNELKKLLLSCGTDE